MKDNTKIKVSVLNRIGLPTIVQELSIPFDNEDSQMRLSINGHQYYVRNDGGVIESLKEPKKVVGVICCDYEDFLAWKEIQGFQGHQNGDTRKKFHVGNTTYLCFDTKCSTRGWNLDEVTETKLASEFCSDYDEIKFVVQLGLTPNGKILSYSYPENTEPCPMCKGAGRREGSKRNACGHCKGTGRVLKI